MATSLENRVKSPPKLEIQTPKASQSTDIIVTYLQITSNYQRFSGYPHVQHGSTVCPLARPIKQLDSRLFRELGPECHALLDGSVSWCGLWWLGWGMCGTGGETKSHWSDAEGWDMLRYFEIWKASNFGIESDFPAKGRYRGNVHSEFTLIWSLAETAVAVAQSHIGYSARHYQSSWSMGQPSHHCVVTGSYLDVYPSCHGCEPAIYTYVILHIPIPN